MYYIISSDSIVVPRHKQFTLRARKRDGCDVGVSHTESRLRTHVYGVTYGSMWSSLRLAQLPVSLGISTRLNNIAFVLAVYNCNYGGVEDTAASGCNPAARSYCDFCTTR